MKTRFSLLALGLTTLGCLSFSQQASAQRDRGRDIDTTIVMEDFTEFEDPQAKKLKFDRGVTYLYSPMLRDLPDGVDQMAMGRGLSITTFYQFRLASFASFAPGFTLGDESYYYDVKTYNPDVSSLINGGMGNTDSSNISLNRLRQTFIDIPVEIRFFTNKLKKSNRLKLALGGQVGYQIDAMRKFRLTDGEIAKFKRSDELDNLERLRYGVRARIGYGVIGVQVLYMVSDFLKDQPTNGKAPGSMMVGITFTNE